MKGAVLIIGSLLWEDETNALDNEQGKLRSDWRNALDMRSKLNVDVPIRYGRKSSTRRCTYTMIFSNSAEFGKGVIIPFKRKTTGFDTLKEQAINLSYAEGISSIKYPDRLISSWGVVGIIFNKSKEDKLKDIINRWHFEFRDFKNSNKFRLKDEKPSVLDNGELNFKVQIPENIDYVFATPVIPNVNEYPNKKKIIEAIMESKPRYDTYLIKNFENGIRVKGDKEIIRSIQ